MNTNFVISDVDQLAAFLKNVQSELEVVFVTGINQGGTTRKKDATKKSDEHIIENRKFLFGTDYLKDGGDIRPFIKYQPIYLATVPKELIKEEFLKPAKNGGEEGGEEITGNDA